ncbi:MAG: Kelch repeat-containing protein [Planctomycetota bacterium]
MRCNVLSGLLSRGLRRSSVAACCAAVLAPVVAAQGPLTLELRGGSYPGSLDVEVHPGRVFDTMLLAMGVDSGPTPLSLLDPADPRSVQVGLNGIQLFFGFFGIDQRASIHLTVPTLPGLLDVPLFFQALTPGGVATFVDEVSPPGAVRFAPAGTWRDRGVFTADERSFARMLPRADGRWMIVGGGSGALFAQIARQDCEIYDDMTDAFVAGPVMTQARSLHTATLLADGRWLLVGGVNAINDPQVECEVYDPATDQFTAVAPMATPRIGHSATLLSDGRVFVAGGLTVVTLVPSPLTTLFSATDLTEIYDPVAGTWTPGPNLLTPRAGHIAVPRPNGTLLMAGGISWDPVPLLPTIRATTDVVAPLAGTVVAGPSMAAARALIDPIDLGGDRWLLAGGIDATGVSGATAEVYDAVANTWTAAGSMAAARSNHVAAPLGGGRWLVAGGADGTILAPVPLASVEIYDAVANSWSPGPSLSIPRTAAGSLITPRGTLHLVSGGTSNGALTRTSEWFHF